ncbi:MAG: hypothetical protein ABI912_03550 [Actinomycetota bacterium]
MLSLAALKSDPMATVAISATQKKILLTHQGKTFGMPVHAGVLRLFSLDSGTLSGSQALDDAAAQARSAGWALRQVAGGSYASDKTIRGTRASLIIAVDTIAVPPQLVVSIVSID